MDHRCGHRRRPFRIEPCDLQSRERFRLAAKNNQADRGDCFSRSRFCCRRRCSGSTSTSSVMCCSGRPQELPIPTALAAYSVALLVDLVRSGHSMVAVASHLWARVGSTIARDRGRRCRNRSRQATCTLSKCKLESRLPLNQIFDLSIEEIELPVVGLAGATRRIPNRTAVRHSLDRRHATRTSRDTRWSERPIGGRT